MSLLLLLDYDTMLSIVLNKQWSDEHYLIFILQETARTLSPQTTMEVQLHLLIISHLQ